MPAPARIPRADWNLLAVCGAIGFGLSLAVHLLTFVGIAAQESIPATWVLQAGVFPLFFIAVWRLNARRGSDAGGVPAWGWIGLALLCIYAFVNFFVTPGMAPAAIRIMRMFSGHWLVFYAFPTVCFLYR